MKMNDGSISSRRTVRYFLRHNRRQKLGGLIFFIGALIGFGFNGLAVIADLNGASFWGDPRDAANFDRALPIQADLVKIQCPILLAPGEAGSITATFRNPDPMTAELPVKVFVSKDDFKNYRGLTGSLLVEPLDKQDFRWQVNQPDIIEGNFILTRVFLMYEDTPARTESCGIFVLGLFGLKGTALVVLILGTSLSFLFVGSVLLYRGSQPYQESSPPIEVGLVGLAAILAIGMIANLLGWWIFSGLVLVLAVLLTLALIPSMLN